MWSRWGQNIHQVGAVSEGVVATGIGVSVLLPAIWAASVAVFFQDLSAPGPVPNCGMAWAGCLFSWEQGPSVLVPSTA